MGVLSRRITLNAGLLVALLALSWSPSAAALDQPADGYTALITFPNSFGDAVIVPQSGGFSAQVQIFSNQSGEWVPVSIYATLRVFEDSLTGGIDRASIGFTSSTDGPVTINFPDNLGTAPVDVFVTFSSLGVDPETGRVPTSHHHLVKNRAILMGDFALADSLDHHSTRVLTT